MGDEKREGRREEERVGGKIFWERREAKGDLRRGLKGGEGLGGEQGVEDEGFKGGSKDSKVLKEGEGGGEGRGVYGAFW